MVPDRPEQPDSLADRSKPTLENDFFRLTLDPHQPWIELELTIRDKARDNWPEADWLSLPFKIDNPRFQVHRALGVMDPATDILPGANRDLFTVGHGVVIVGEDGAGMAVCPLDHPLVSLDRPGCWKFSPDAAAFTPKQPVVHVNLYNNQWNTNFRYWYPGTWSSRVRLWPFDAATPPEAVMAVPALEARHPLQVIAATGRGRLLPATQSGITVSRQGAPVTAFGANPDGEGTLLRIWEMAGVSGEVVVTLPGAGPVGPSARPTGEGRSGRAGFRFTNAIPVNLRGEKIGDPVAIRNGRFSFPLEAHAPASFILQESSVRFSVDDTRTGPGETPLITPWQVALGSDRTSFRIHQRGTTRQ